MAGSEPTIRVETRPLTAVERQRLLEECGQAVTPGQTTLMLGWFGVVIPAVGAMAGSNVAAAQGWPEGRAAVAGFVLVLAAALVGFWRLRRADRRVGAWLRAWRGRQLEAGPVERWRFEPARAWNVACLLTRGLLFELADGRLLLLACRQLEPLPPDTFPERLELEALPQLDRVLSLRAAGEPRPTQPERLSLEELGNDQPAKKRRFVEIAPEALDHATRSRLGWEPRPVGPEPDAPAPAEGGAPRLDRAVGWEEALDRQRRLVPRTARARVALWMWSPALAALLLLTAGLAFPGRLRLGPGVVPSLIAALVAVWVFGVLRGESARRRAVARVLSEGPRAAPRAWQRAGRLVLLRGRVRGLRTLASSLAGQRGVFLRLHLGQASLMRAEDFAIEAEDGRTARVDVSHAWLARSSAHERVARLEATSFGRLHRRAGIAIPPPPRRWHFPSEQMLQEGDRICVLGLASEDPEPVVHGTADWPLLVWAEGTAVEEQGL